MAQALSVQFHDIVNRLFSTHREQFDDEGMAWNIVNLPEQRLRFVLEAERGEASFSELCRQFGIGRTTGYKWRRRFQADGMAGLAERSRRPLHSPGRTAESIEQQVVAERQRRGWGARKLEPLLARQGVGLAVGTIHRILLRRGLVAEEERHRPALKRFEHEQPNQLWQMDFKGVPQRYAWCGVAPLSVLDDHSRYLLGLEALKHTQGQAVRQVLEQIFGEAGLPEAMLLDHGAPWWNMQGAGWTKLSVWLMQQGIRLRFSGIRHPQTQGKVERFHGSLAWSWKQCGYPQPGSWQSWLDEFRQEYNHERPHEALGMQTPASRWRPSEQRWDPTPRSWEYPPGAWVKRLGVEGGLWLGNHRWEVSRALADQRVQLVEVERRILVYYCRTVVREIDLEQGRSLPAQLRLGDFVWPRQQGLDAG